LAALRLAHTPISSSPASSLRPIDLAYELSSATHTLEYSVDQPQTLANTLIVHVLPVQSSPISSMFDQGHWTKKEQAPESLRIASGVLSVASSPENSQDYILHLRPLRVGKGLQYIHD